jgi:signal transduction histidine kinase/HAMP domain-containing protein
VKFLTNLTLGKKITLLTVLGLLVGVGIFSTLGMRAVNQATETMLQDRLTTARLVADYIDESLTRAVNELQYSTRRMAGDITEDGLNSEIKALQETFSKLAIEVQGIYLVDRDGRITRSWPEIPGAIGNDLAAEVGPSLPTGPVNVSGIVSAPGTDIPVVMLAGPLVSGGNGGTGALVVAVNLTQSNIGGFVQPIRLGQTGYVEIVDREGTVVARTQPGPELAPFEKSDHSGRFAALISAGNPTRGVCHTCHEPDQTVARRDVLAFVPLTAARWGVVIRQSEDEALAPVSELRQSLFIFGAVLVSVALGFVVVTTRNIGSRIMALNRVSQRMAEGDLSSPVENLGKDEVGILATTIDDMRVKLKDSYGNLEQRTRELSSLLSVSEVLNSTLDLTPLLDAVLDRAVEIISDADAGALLFLDADKKNLVIRCVSGLDKASLPQVIPLPAAPDDGPGEVDLLLGSLGLTGKVKSSIWARVMHRGEHIGSIIVFSFESTRGFSDSDRRLVQAIADDIAIAFERDQLSREADEAWALYQTDRLRSEFISSVSHELRTPLSFIKGYSTSLLREDIAWDKKTQQEFLTIIDEKTDELRDLIDKLLLSAKLEAGALKLEKEPVLIPRLAGKISEELMTRTRNHKISQRFAPSFPVIEADMRCVEQVLRNLVENSVKYSPEGSDVVVTGNFDKEKVTIGVKDNGQGIPPEHQAHVFERFYRVNSPATRGIGGSGLGLSIVKGHVEAHGGKVWLESVPGKGSVFYFTLPINDDKNSREDLELEEK